MDPYSQRNQLKIRDPRSDGSEHDQTQNPDRNAAVSGNPQQTDRQPRYSDGFTMIPPNESRRSEMTMNAQKEEEAFQRWKETNRVTSVHVNPERLGGNVSLAEARQKQLTNLRCSKLQKKLKQDEQEKKRKREEEEKIQKMRAEQRQKAERLKERNEQEDQRRKEQLRQDHLRTTDSFLQSLERRAPGPVVSGCAPHTSSRSEAVESKQTDKPEKSVRDVQLEHRKVNAAFLEKLEGRGRGSENGVKMEGVQEAERPCLASEDFRQRLNISTDQQVHLAHLKPDPERSCSDGTEKADPEPDYDWALMKLMNSFPDYNKVFLDDILQQCSGNYEEACTLLL
uniref:CUE domain-containing protein n=1 Tax=Anabas testudineus TaxID=64144 RepID=A0AAQ6IDA3_ANATE